MNIQKDRYAWMVKIGEKGQFVIPKEARDMFNLLPGDEILVLGDKNRGIAILPKDMQKEYISKIFTVIEE
ncbi:MAG: AbrB/MazE/SpoVT family DNA-binding domain-containing protein [Ruminococcaceae bacterium]|nr:AbrB/MazE/SpoVT family DNA-binding domain-containing protein [Oscillospiraceae bacterium]